MTYQLHCQMYMYNSLILDKHPNFKQKITSLQSRHNYQVRNTILRNYFCRISLCKQSLMYNAIKSWNALENIIKKKKKLKSLRAFKSACKKQIIMNYQKRKLSSVISHLQCLHIFRIKCFSHYVVVLSHLHIFRCCFA